MNDINKSTMQEWWRVFRLLLLALLAVVTSGGLLNYASMFFYGASSLKTVDLEDWDFSAVTSAPNQPFVRCTSLTTVKGRIHGIKYSMDISPCPLTRESALLFINGLETVADTHTLKLSNTTKAALTEDDVKIATDKGWTIA